MLQIIKTNILRPLLARVGTATSAALVMSLGTNPTIADQVAVGVMGVGLVIFDLVTSWVNRKAVTGK